MEQYPHSDITEKIISAVYEVYNRLGPGFLEPIYEHALIIALRKRGLRVESQRIYRIIFDGQIIGEHRIDLLVEGKVIIELKAVQGIMPNVCKAQLISYLKLTKLLVGLLVNFGNDTVEIKRLQNKWEIERLMEESSFAKASEDKEK